MFVPAIVNGVETELLVDSGAMVTIVSPELLARFPGECGSQMRKTERPVKLETASECEQLDVKGVVTLMICIGNQFFEWDAYVAPISEHCLLGYDFLYHFECVLDARRGLTIGKVDLPCEIRGQELPVFRVALRESTELPANSEKIIEGLVVGPGDFVSRYGVLEPTEMKDDFENIMIARSLCNACRSDIGIPVRVMNTSQEVLTLQSGMTLGYLHGVDASEVFDASVESRSGCSFNVNNVRGTDSCDNQDPVSLPSEILELFSNASEMLSAEQQQMLLELLHKHESVFAKSPTDLGRTSLIQHEIDTGDARPIRQAVRRPPKAFEHEEEAIIQSQLEAGVIKESCSPWASPVVFVRKKDGSVRPCVDYRKLNEITRKDAYPLPRMDDCLDSMSGANLFSTLDLQSGYWQIEVKESDRPKTAFITRSGLYEYQTLPFGLCSAPSTFQRCMELVLRGLQWKTLLIYLDDVIIFSKTFGEHLEKLDEVFTRFRNAGLKLKPSKCELFKTEVSFLGHIVTREGIKTDPKKIETVQNWPVPRNVTDIRSFLGLCSYYRRFVPNFADIASPLHRLLEAGQCFVWDSKCQHAFETLKSFLIGSKVMSYPNDTGIFILDTDASDRGIGATLSQVQWDEERKREEERPISYASRSMSRTQRRYCTTRRELLAVVVFANYFRHYLLGRKFIIRTDHSALRWIMSFKEPENQTARWIEILSQFDFKIEHRAGKRHANADALSRIPCDPEVCDCYDDVTILSDLPCGGCDTCLKKHKEWSDFSKLDDVLNISARIVIGSDRNGDTAKSVAEELNSGEDDANLVNLDLSRDGVTRILLVCLFSMWLTIIRSANWIYGFPEFPFVPFWCLRTVKALGRGFFLPVSKILGVHVGKLSAVVRHGRATDSTQGTFSTNKLELKTSSQFDFSESVFSELSKRDLIKAQLLDADLCRVITWLRHSSVRPERENIKADSLSPTVRNLWLLWDQLFLKDDVLCKRWERTKSKGAYIQVVIPKNLRENVLRAAHDNVSSAHLGVNKTLRKIQRNYYWYGMKVDVRNWIKKCAKCGARKRPNRTPRAPLVSFNAGAPMDRVATDILGPFPVSERGNRYILVVGDLFTKWIEAYAIPDMLAETVARKLVYEFFSRFGNPLSLHSDQGRTYEARLFQEVCKLLEIRKTRTTPYHPSSNGMIERFNQTLVNMISMYVDRKQVDWDAQLPLLTSAYRTCEHAGTGFTPNFLMLGRETHTPLNLLVEGVTADESSDSYGEFAWNLKQTLCDVHSIVRENLETWSSNQKRDYDTRLAQNNFSCGDLVYHKDDTKMKGLSPKLKGEMWKGPFVVTKKFSDILFEIKSHPRAKGKILHHNRLKPYLSDDIPEELLKLQESARVETDSHSVAVQTESTSPHSKNTIRGGSKRERRPPQRLEL